MKRRDFTIGLMLGAAVGQVRSQEKGLAVVGFLSSNAPGTYAPAVAAFRQGLAETGYIEGQNVAIEYRWAEGRYGRLPALAAELVGRKVDVVAAGSLTAIRAAKSATSTTPIVFFGGDDPVKQGLVASLARPGGNLTGISVMASELMPKRLELLSELVAHTMPLALLVNPNNGSTEPMIPDMQGAARMKGVQLHVLKADLEAEIDTAFATLVQQHASGLVVAPDAVFDNRREHLVALAAHHAVPTIYFAREFVAIGGLISYGASLTPPRPHISVPSVPSRSLPSSRAGRISRVRPYPGLWRRVAASPVTDSSVSRGMAVKCTVINTAVVCTYRSSTSHCHCYGCNPELDQLHVPA